MNENNLHQLYQKAVSTLQKQNWDYAIALFSEVLERTPSHAAARSNLRLAQLRKFENKKFQVMSKIVSKIFKIGPRLMAAVYWQKKDWPAVLRELEKPLRVYPRDIRVLKKMAAAAERAELAETACGIYESVHIIKPTDVYSLKQLGRLYRSMDENNKARYYYEKAVLTAPTDYEAKKGLQDLAALSTISKGWDQVGTYREKLSDEKQADIFEKEKRITQSKEDKLSLIDHLEKELAKTPVPVNIQTIKKLAGLYASIEEFDKALELYEKIPNPDLETKKEISLIKTAKLKDRPDLQKQVILSEMEARVKEFPTHLPLRYEMGILYAQNGLLDKAIGEFQISVKDPKYMIPSLNHLGLCFQKKGLYDLAANQFQKAQAGLDEWTDLKKDIVYNLAGVYAAMGNAEKAIVEYKKIYEQDINFRDIASKINR